MNRPSTPDQVQRERALDSARSILVQAPAGSGKTDLLTRRFLRLLAEVEEPGQIVAITFTIAAAAEMRHRILSELEKAAANPNSLADEFSMAALAHRALLHSEALGWNLLDLPSQLRVCTIDSFCRELALQQPLLSGLGGGLDIAAQPSELYRRAARETLKKIDQSNSPLGAAIEELLQWRDNNWQEMEELLVEMLGNRDRWMHGFVLDREPEWDLLRERLERPFAHAVRDALLQLSQLLDQAPGAREETLTLARFACEQSGGQLHHELAETAEFPVAPFHNLEEARELYTHFADLLLTAEGRFRKAIDKRLGFPADRKREKARLLELISALAALPGLEATLAEVRALPPTRYTEEDWQIVRACFTLLRQAAGELQIAFAEAGRVDFIEVAQIAQRVLRGPDGLPTDAALAVSEGIRHLLVDEFQDTSRRQHQLLASLIAAWPERPRRTCFVVGDPMQSIYFFRDADAELFPRVKNAGLEIPSEEPLLFDFVPLTANFRTAPGLVGRLNQAFAQIFADDDGSGVAFSSAQPARVQPPAENPVALKGHDFSRAAIANFSVKGTGFSPYIDPALSTRALAPEGISPPFSSETTIDSADSITTTDFFALHLRFLPQTGRAASADPENEAARSEQIDEIVALIRNQMERMEAAKARGEKFRIAVLGRARTHLAPIAAALREAKIPFRALDLEKLADRPEVLDALALARALLNSQDRVAWLGLLRAPWCGLSLDDLHSLAGDGAPELLTRPVPELLAERLTLLSEAGRAAGSRVLNALTVASTLRASQPTLALGSWLEQIWLQLGGAACVDSTARANLNLLWSCLDRLPSGEEDLLGPGLNAALDKLTALPDPEASSDCGVQLMTIHKSKGLEFEVVIVPELQAASGRATRKMLTWLERGLNEPDDSGEITEFLIAPFQRKGQERGSAKAWVDLIYRERESQEMRRILYVAATRARDELHLFARPACKQAEDGSLALVEPTNSLLATAWPALEEEVRERFEGWKVTNLPAKVHAEDEVYAIAASSESNLLAMPLQSQPTLLRRLPNDYQRELQVAIVKPGIDAALGAPSFPRTFAEWVGDHEAQPAHSSFAVANPNLYSRHEGGLLSRALGKAVHALLEELARLRETLDWEAARSTLPRFVPRIHAQIRAVGVDQPQAARIAAEALQLTLDASRDPVGSWILSPHPNAGSEAAWAGVAAGALRTVRVDRVFLAGPAPCVEGEDCWWIIDYKTAHADALDPAEALPALRPLFAPQIEAYAQLLRNQIGAESAIFAGLYYPRLRLLDWWQI